MKKMDTTQPHISQKQLEEIFEQVQAGLVSPMVVLDSLGLAKPDIKELIDDRPDPRPPKDYLAVVDNRDGTYTYLMTPLEFCLHWVNENAELYIKGRKSWSIEPDMFDDDIRLEAVEDGELVYMRDATIRHSKITPDDLEEALLNAIGLYLDKAGVEYSVIRKKGCYRIEAERRL